MCGRFIAAHFSHLVVHNMSLLGQGLTAAVVPGDLDQTGGLQALQTNLAADGDPGVDVLMVVLLIVVCVLFVASIFQSLGRIMVLMVLTTMVPIGLVFHALPQTDPIAWLWWRGFASCLVIPIVQAFFPTAGQWLLLDPKNLLPVYGLQVEPGGVVNLLVVIVLLSVTVKIPKMLRRWSGQGRQRRRRRGHP